MASFRFYTTSSDTWRAMIEDIRNARSSIYWESFVLINDVRGFNFFKELKAKSRRGVDVKIVVDSWGSFSLSLRVMRDLRRAGVEVLLYNRFIPWWNPTWWKYRWFHRNHKKMLIIDRHIGYIGGVNVRSLFQHWQDLQVRLQGKIVEYFVSSFVHSYSLSGGVDRIHYRSVWLGGKLKVFHHSPLIERGVLKNYYKVSLRSARKKVEIVTPYFIPQPWLMRALRCALRRGVCVDILMPLRTSPYIANIANYTFASLMSRKGIRFYVHPLMNHAKAIMVDSKQAMIGSQNIDAYSFDYNVEGGIVFERKDMLIQLQNIIDRWRSESQELIFKSVEKSLYKKVQEAIVLALSAYL